MPGNSAVQRVRAIAGDGEAGSTYAMERDLPSGRAENELEVLARDEPNALDIRTTSGPTPFLYRYRFTRDGDGTIVKRGVDANFATLRQLLET